ncbi:SDR family oxidoreductase [Caulobacter sp. KR2-114]|uniref:SDR family oxidoreductase n=1 Tax=Caulobacter sp. KR2-114 TaxID=3400912 RepID=UPI003BFB4FA9
MTTDIAGRTVIITGAGGGIGEALALGFLADGARVVGADVDLSGLERLAARGVVTRRCDVTVEAEVRALIAAAQAETGRVDVLFNNAGLGHRHRIDEIPDGLFERMAQVSLFGPFYAIRAALPVMRAQGYGRVVNMISRGAEARAPGWAGYASAKAGLFALTRVAAAETQGADILVNAMIPGPTRSGMNQGPGLQEPAAVYPHARWMASLPSGGPNGEVFWNSKPYALFAGGATREA